MAAKRRVGPAQSPGGAERSGAAPKALDGGGPMRPDAAFAPAFNQTLNG